jgi:hypothetical protein
MFNNTTTIFKFSAHNMNDTVWIGLFKDAGVFGWSDDRDMLAFQYFDDGQPDGQRGGVDENCAALYGVTHWWHDMPCNERFAFVCAKEM